PLFVDIVVNEPAYDSAESLIRVCFEQEHAAGGAGPVNKNAAAAGLCSASGFQQNSCRGPYARSGKQGEDKIKHQDRARKGIRPRHQDKRRGNRGSERICLSHALEIRYGEITPYSLTHTVEVKNRDLRESPAAESPP